MSAELIVILVFSLFLIIIVAFTAKLYSDLTNQRRFYEEKINALSQGNENMILKFKDISSEILKNQAVSFDEHQKAALENIVNPFRNEINDFKAKIDIVHKDTIASKSSLEEQLKYLMTLNQNLSKDAENLAEALKGKKKLQGNWGELQLARVLEISGLEEGISYRMQVNLKDEEGNNLRPDCIVYMPSHRSIVIDSKVSLNEYVEYVSSDNEDEKDKHLEEYIKCLKRHINDLSHKEYQNLVKDNTLDYVMMFVPIEGAYIEAIKKDIGLFDYAYKNKVAIATPSSLLPLLKLVESMWRVEKQSKSASDIAQTASLLYDKIANFTDDMKKIGDSLDKASDSYNAALKKLSTGKGNALSLTQKLINLGAKTNKSINIDFENSDSIPNKQ